MRSVSASTMAMAKVTGRVARYENSWYGKRALPAEGRRKFFKKGV